MRTRATRRELLTAIGATTVAAAGTGSVTGQERESAWRSFGFDAANTGYNPTASGPDTDAGPVWHFETAGSVTSSPAIVDGRVYVGSDDDFLYAVDAESGAEAWAFETGGSVASSPAVADGRVYVGSGDDFVYAVDAESGEEAWAFETAGNVRSSPTVADGRVYVGSNDARVYAIDADTGLEEWHFETDFDVRASPAVAEIEADEGPRQLVFVSSDDGFLYALDAGSGEEVWRFDTDELMRSSPTVAEIELDGEARSLVYFGSNDGRIYALDAASGEEEWTVQTGGAIPTSPAVRTDGNEVRVYVGSRDQTLYALDGETGDEVWRFETNRTITASPAVTDDAVFFGTDGNDVFGVEVDSGEQLWQFETGRSVISSPAVVDETVYVGSDDRLLYALQEGGSASPPDDDDDEPAEEEGMFERISFLFIPLVFLLFMAAVYGAFRAGKRAGLLQPREDDPIGYPNDEPESGEAGDGTSTDDASGVGEGDELPLWEVVRDDVIRRAEETSRTATEDLLVTKYVDAGTLDAPMVAYEIESYRDEPTTVRIVEAAPDLSPDAIGQLPGSHDNWTVADDQLVFEVTIDPDETIETLVARRDIEPDDVDALLERPTVEIADE